jgi:hypothetical protein
MAATESEPTQPRPTAGDASYAAPPSLPSTNPPAPPGPFDPRPPEWHGPTTVDSHIAPAPHGAFDSMVTPPTVTGVDGDTFEPLRGA